jgi:hypothetical protein
MRTATHLLPVLVAAATGGCIDIDLLDDMAPLDAGTEDGTGDGAAGSGDTDGNDDNAPPSTDPNDKAPPSLKALSCASGERLADLVCIAEGPVSATLRFGTTEPATVALETAEPDLGSETLSGAWSAEHHVVVGGLPAGGGAAVRLVLADVNGNTARVDLELGAAAGWPVAVTEVYADPAGPEPAQEFVEIVNLGSEAIDLSGWMIDDEDDANGDLLPDGTLLDPGQAALLVAPAFDAACADDPAPAPGTLIVYLGSSIGSNGLKNTEAETIELYDASGTLVSGYGGGMGKPAAGVSAFRLRAELPDADPWAWAKGSAGSATPGSVPTID